MPLQHYIDQPGDWTHLSRCVIVRGWCFGDQPGAVRGVRLRAGNFTLAGAIGFPRPDVKAALPAAPDNNTGFEIRGTLPGGNVRVVIEAELAGGTWTPLFDRVVRVKRQFLPLWLGGGDWMELMFFQMPAHMAYAPRAVEPERFPKATAPVRPKISIVTPSYQQARYLGQTMSSVLDQTGVACEYVVRDGGSTDGSAQLIAAMEAGDRRRETGKPIPSGSRHDLHPASANPASGLPSPASPRLLAWSSERDAGQADAIAKGFAQTSGGPDDLMAWINSDDYYLPGALTFVADYFARHPDVDMVYGHRIVVNESSQEVARWFLPPHDAEVLRLNDFVPQETLFWRRRIWDKAGGLDTSFKFAIDWDLLLRCQAAGARIVRLPYFLACFRVHAAQKTTAFMHSTGQTEITKLRERTHGRSFPAREIEGHPLLLQYLRQSAWIEFLWRRLGVRAP